MTNDQLRCILPDLREFVATPGSIESLRRLILAHAFSGRLRQATAAVDNADDILERIQLSVRATQAKQVLSNPFVPNVETLYPLPQGWRWVRLSAVCTHIVDCLHRTPVYSASGYPAIRTNDILPGRLLFKEARRVSREEYLRQTQRLVPRAGDVFYSREGNYGMAAVVPEDVEVCLSQRMMQFRLHEGIDPAYFSWALNSPVMFEQAKKSVIGTTVPHINIKALKEFAFPLAPSSDQRCILKWIDKAMSLIDRLKIAYSEEEEQRRLLAKSALRKLSSSVDNFALDHLKELIRTPADVSDLEEAALGLALTGHLVEPDPACGTADSLLAQIAAEKETLGLSGEIATLEPNDSLALPTGWRLVALGDILFHCRNGTSAKPNDTGVGYPVLRISAATSRRDSVVDLLDYKFAELPEDQAKPYFIRPNDLLACRFNGNLHYVGKVSQVPSNVSDSILHPDKLICMRAIIVSHAYLRYVLNSRFVRKQIESVAVTTAGNIGINGKQIKSLAVPLAPLSEQHRIASRLDEVFALLGQLAEFLQ